jgi:polyribonucleotide nucleotidyltransferase
MPIKHWKRVIAGRELLVERGRLAGQANGSVLLTYGGTMVLATAVISKHPKVGGDFFPLTVEFEEKLYAAGKIKGSRFVKREGRATDEAVLSGRVIDRTIRPLFDQRTRNEVQVVITVLSIDGENDPDILGVIGASLALGTSNIPWGGPVGAVRVAIENGGFSFNPSYPARKQCEFEAIVAGTKDRINMIEAGAREISEEKILEALDLAQGEIRKLIEFEEEIIADVKPDKITLELAETDKEVLAMLKEYATADKMEDAIYQKEKSVMAQKLNAIKDAFMEAVAAKWPDDGAKKSQADYLFEEEISEIVHKHVLESNRRPDGRKLDEVREISCEVGLLARTHGSAVFNRGTTQALGVLTLGSPGDEQIIENIEEAQEFKKRFMLHYNFPPFSVGEIKPMRGPGRREIGHGALAERALEPLLPPKESFPYTIRVVSEILSSNGSSSMATVSACSLALMDGGVPVKAPAAGIAMGLMIGDKGAYKVLTDIQGPEDHHGDMDFKVAGTADGVTALQMDVKIDGVTVDMLKNAFAQAKDARLHILSKIKEVLPAPRAELSPFAPRITTLHINPEKIRDVIGPGGKMINEIIAETGVQIDIEDDGTVFVTAVDQSASEKAIEWIQQLTREVKVGELFEKGKVTRLMDFGAFVEVLPNQEGLVHISEMAPWRVERVEDVVKIGDVIPVYVKEIDELGRINLSLKIARNMLGLEHPNPPAGGAPAGQDGEKQFKHFGQGLRSDDRPHGHGGRGGGRRFDR